MVDQRTGAGPVAADGQVRLMTKVAHLYHEQGIRQSDIAETLHISQARVSRLLKRAVDLGIVRTIVVVAQGLHTDLERSLKQRFGLAEAVVVEAETDEASILRDRISRRQLFGDHLDRRQPAGHLLLERPPCWRWSIASSRYEPSGPTVSSSS